MSAQPPKPNPLDELKTGLQESPPLDELKAGLADKQPLVQGAQPRYAFGWFDKWLLAIPIAIGVVVLLLLWISCSGTPPPTTATLQAPAPDATLQVGEPLTITGSAPPNSTVQIYNHGQLVAETTADENGNFVVRFVPVQAGDYELSAVATVDGQTLESPPISFVIAEGSGQTALEPTAAALTLTAIPVTGASGTSVAGSFGGTPVPGTEGGAQGATTPGTEGGAQGGSQGATAVPGTAGGTPETSPTTATLNTPPADATLQAGESLTITGTAPPNSTVQIYNQEQLVAQTTADANGNFGVSFVPAQAGAYELEAIATAADGTTFESPPMQFVVAESSGQTPETSPTTATLNTPPADATLQVGESLTITGTAPPNSTVQIYNQGQLVAQTTADPNGNFVVSFVPAQAGAYELSAVATVEGQTLESPPVSLEIAESGETPVAGAEGGAQGATTPGAQGGATAPTTTTLQAPAPDASLQVGEPLTITGTAPPNSTVQLYNNGQLVTEATADENGNFVVSFTPLQPGAYELSAVATVDGQPIESPPIQFVISDESGGTPVPGTAGGAQGATTPDAQGGAAAPTTTTLQTVAADGTPRVGEPLTITGTAPPNSIVQLYNNGQLVAETTADANGNFVVSFTPLQPGTYELSAVATVNGQSIESPPVSMEIAEGSGQTAQGPTLPAPTLTAIAAAGASGTSVAGSSGGTPVPGTEGSTQGSAPGATPIPGAEGSTQGGAQGATAIPGTESSTQGGTQGATPVPGTEGSAQSGAQGSTPPESNTQAAADAAPPTVKVLAGQWLAPGTAITGTGVPGTVVTLYLDDIEIGSATVGADGTWQFTMPMTVAPGDYLLRVVTASPDGSASGTTSETGNGSESQQVQVTVPAMTLPVTGGKSTNHFSCQWLWSGCCWR